MDWKTFIVNIVDAIVWPILIWYFIYEFKDKIIDFIYRIKKVKHKDTEIELFAQEIKELKEKSVIDSTPKIEELGENELKEKYDFLLNLANISPRSAIIESFITLESSMNKAIAKLNLGNEKYISKSPMQRIKVLLDADFISKDQYDQLERLRDLRNKASHLEDFELKDMPIEVYIDISLTLSNYFYTKNL
jgi:hypothetical protein